MRSKFIFSSEAKQLPNISYRYNLGDGYKSYSKQACFGEFRKKETDFDPFSPAGEYKEISSELTFRISIPDVSDIASCRLWAEFMCECGFPVTVEGNEFVVDRINYMNLPHFWAGLTAIRYPIYNTFGHTIINITDVILSCYRNLPDLDAYQCLLLGHCWMFSSYYDPGHSMLRYHHFKLITKEEAMGLYKNTKSLQVNDNATFYIQRNNEIYKELYTLIKEEKWQDVLEKIKKEKLI